MTLLKDYSQLRRELDEIITELGTLTQLCAEIEYKHDVALAKEIFKIHEQCSAWTTCETLAKGNEYVADLRYQLDIVKRKMDTKKEKINAIKKVMTHIENQIQREWTQAGDV